MILVLSGNCLLLVKLVIFLVSYMLWNW